MHQPWSHVAVPMRQADSIAIWTYEAARRLAREHDVMVVGRRFPDQSATEVHDGVRYERVDPKQFPQAVRKLLGRLRLAPVGRGSRLYGLEYALKAAFSLREGAPDLVHLHNLSQFAPVFRAVSPKVPIVLHMHCEWLSQLGRGVAESRIDKVSRVVSCSEYVSRRTQQRFPQLGRRFGVLHNGVDLSWFGGIQAPRSVPADGGRVLFVGRITPEKGLHDLLLAFEALLRVRPKAELRIVGPFQPTPAKYIVGLAREKHVKALSKFYSDSYLEYLKRSVPEGVLARVSFVGELGHEDLRQEYGAAHVLAAPSLSEAFGMSLVEAMASGLPVVATRVGGMSEIVEEGQAGLLVPAGNSELLSQALTKVLEDEELRAELSEKGRHRVESCFSWNQVVEQAEAHYAETLEVN